MVNLRGYLDSAGVTNRVLVPLDIDALLRSVDQVVARPGAPSTLDGRILVNPPLPGFLGFTLATGHPAVVPLGGIATDCRVDIALLGKDPLFHLPTTLARVRAGRSGWSRSPAACGWTANWSSG